MRPHIDPRGFFGAILDHLTQSSLAIVSERFVKAVAFEPHLSDHLVQVQNILLERLNAFGLEPPAPQDIHQEVAEKSGGNTRDVEEIIDLLVDQGKVTRLLDKLLFSAEHIRRLEAKVVTFLKTHGEMTTPQLKELTGTSRKYTVPLGEYLDAKRITIRVGDARKLRG